MRAGGRRSSRHSLPLADTVGALPRGPAIGERVIDWGRGRTDTAGLSRQCAHPTPRTDEGRESRGPEAGVDRRSWPEPTMWAAPDPRLGVARAGARRNAGRSHRRHAWANRVAGRDRAGREPQGAIWPVPEK